MFEPDCRHVLEVMANRRPERLPLYEHIVSPAVMERILGVEFASLHAGDPADLGKFFSQFCRFFREMTFDTVSYEVCITEALPDSGAIMGGRPGPIQNRKDFEQYPWDEVPQRYWERAHPQFRALRECLPAGMKAIGGVGNGAFEISEDLVGFEYLAYMQMDDPELFADLYAKIGDLMAGIWTTFLAQYTDVFCVCRFGDDLGFKTSLLTSPTVARDHVLPQYRRIIDLVHKHDRPFLWHSCGCIFQIMEDLIALGIDAKHSNEDAIAPYDRWIADYGGRIGLFGGIDVDILCQRSPDEVFERVVESGLRFRASANGYALGSGNSIPDYVPENNFLAMVNAVQDIRRREIL